MPMLVCKGAGSMEEKEGSYITISGLTKEGIEILFSSTLRAEAIERSQAGRNVEYGQIGRLRKEAKQLCT